MRISSVMRRWLPVVAVTSVAACFFSVPSMRAQTKPQAQTTILTPQDVSKIMPATVFFRGQSATVQMRNTFGLRFPDGKLMLAGLVDSSGYSSGIREKYQGYILTETTVMIDGMGLPAGAYGFGFLANDKFVVMNIGAMDVMNFSCHTDAAMTHPQPLAIIAGKRPGSFRLYEGRKFVTIQVK